MIDAYDGGSDDLLSWGNLGQVAKFKSILAQMRRTTLFMDRERLV